MGISRLHFVYLLISTVLYVLTSLTFSISGLHLPHFWSWKLLTPVLLLTSLIGLIDHYKFDMNIGLRIAKAMKVWKYQKPPDNIPPDEPTHRAQNQIWEGYRFIAGPLLIILNVISGILEIIN